MEAQKILNQALKEMDARGKQSKDGTKERSMAATVAAFNAITGRELTETEGWMFMVVLKAVRTVQRVGSIDSFVDGAAYFSLAGESVEPTKDEPKTSNTIDDENNKLISIDGKNYFVPLWVEHIAQDADGKWRGYTIKPELYEAWGGWFNIGIYPVYEICNHDPNLDYRKTYRAL